MAEKSAIEWTNSSWNPVTGCTKISSGCLNCYANTLAKRLQMMDPKGKYRNGFKLTLHEKDIEDAQHIEEMFKNNLDMRKVYAYKQRIEKSLS